MDQLKENARMNGASYTKLSQGKCYEAQPAARTSFPVTRGAGNNNKHNKHNNSASTLLKLKSTVWENSDFCEKKKKEKLCSV